MTDQPNRSLRSIYPFQPAGGANLSVSSSSGRVAMVGGGPEAVVTNYGSVAAFVEFGTVAVVATTASTCVLPGTSVVFSIPGSLDSNTYIAGITASGTTSIQVSTGQGV